METDARIDAMEAVVQTKVERSVGPLARDAAGGLAAAARSIAANPNASVVVLTGAYVPWATQPAAETDGPPGAALLAAGLACLRIPARLLTDHWCAPVLTAARDAAAPDLPLDVCDDNPAELGDLLGSYEQLKVTHVVIVERLGPAKDGAVRNFRGEDVTRFTPSFAPLWGDARPWTTVGVGDGGNEVGMGNIPAGTVAEAIEHGDRVHCVVGCDHLIVAGVSNWGALGLLLAVATLRGPSGADAQEFVRPARHRSVVEACVLAGAVDGTRGHRQATVDGLALVGHDVVLEQLRAAALGGKAE
jgi:hypothetical protein